MSKERLTLDLEFNPRKSLNLIKKLERKALDFSPVFLKAEKELNLEYVKNFVTNGSSVGGWRPLDPQYGAWKSVNFPGRPTLVRSGKLFRSIENFPVRNIGRISATFGTNVEVARFHQYGTWSMPKREIIFEPPMFARRFAKMAAEHVAD